MADECSHIVVFLSMSAAAFVEIKSVDFVIVNTQDRKILLFVVGQKFSCINLWQVDFINYQIHSNRLSKQDKS